MASVNLRVDTSTSTSESPEPSPLFKKQVTGSRAQDESRKLLSHLLSQLETRPKPPHAYDIFKNVGQTSGDIGLAAIVETVRGAVHFKRAAAAARANATKETMGDDEDSDEGESSDVFSTDFTLDLLTQLKDVLIISIAQKWQIFEDSSTFFEPDRRTGGRSKSPRSSHLNVVGRRPRSVSPTKHGRPSGNLLLRCVSVLNSICLEDCRYKIAHPRPSRPPLQLQALTLDVALYLIHSHKKNFKVISQIATAMLPALSTFPAPTHQRLLSFFESVFRFVLEDLSELRMSEAAKFPSGGLEASDMSEHHDFSVSIQVEEADESAIEMPFRPWKPRPDTHLVAANTTAQSLSVHQLASLCAPFLMAVLDVVDITKPATLNGTVSHVFRIVTLFLEAKVDVYSDLLEVVAYGSIQARLGAICLLGAVWPLPSGHVISSQPWTLVQNPFFSRPRCQHEFVPWIFSPSQDCGICDREINGFGLRCPFCNLFSLHFGCYDDPQGTRVFQYSDNLVERVATLHFSSIQNLHHSVIRHNGHTFVHSHFLTLTLCHACHQPLWGVFAQGLQCQSCWQAVHDHCAAQNPGDHCGSSSPTSDALTISWTSLRQTFLTFYGELVTLTPETRTYEEAAVMHVTLLSQLEVLTLGISSGALIVILPNGKSATEAKDFQVDPFELHQQVEACGLCLLTQSLPRSAAMEDFYAENDVDSQGTFLGSWSGVLYVASSIKAPIEISALSQGAVSDLLQVSQSNEAPEESSEAPFEVASIAHIRNALGYGFGLHSDCVAQYMMQRLYFLGFFVVLPDTGHSASDGMFGPDVQCCFPLPLGLDLSTNVETLASAVESCLDDVDLSINEFGFLQLVRRLPCNGMVSDYAVSRMAACVIGWILNEDNHLATVLRNVANLPGVRSADEPPPWPSRIRDIRPAPTTTVNNGGDYVATRKSLLSLYALPWLKALHERDPIHYGKLLFDVCTDGLHFESSERSLQETAGLIDQVLQRIIKLAQASALSSSFDYLFTSWLRLVCSCKVFEKPMPSLFRLFPREFDTAQRWSSVSDGPALVKETVGSMVTDPWPALQDLVSHDGVLFSLECLCSFARSGVDIPLAVYDYLCGQVQGSTATIQEVLVFIKAILSATWIQIKGRDEITEILLTLHRLLRDEVVERLSQGASADSELALTLAICLLLYGCERHQLLAAGLVLDDEVQELPSRRRYNAGYLNANDPIIVNNRIIQAIGDYVQTENHQIALLSAQFFDLFLSSSPLLEAHEIDNFILQNGKALSNCAWQFYTLQGAMETRSTFLLRILSVDARHLLDIILDGAQSAKWETRFVTVGRLFRVILDVSNPIFQEDQRQWQPSVLQIFYSFFHALWSDPAEEVRLEAEACSSSLLPSHFSALSRIWDHAYSKIPQDERLKLISFLNQLHPHFSKWQLVSWTTIIESLADLTEDRNLQFSSPQSLGQDTNTLRVALLLLSLQMVADGIPVDSAVSLELKVHVLDALGFHNVTTTSSSRGLEVRWGELPYLSPNAELLIPELLLVVDSSHRLVSSSGHSQSVTVSPLAGFPFVDLILAVVSSSTNLASLPTLTIKSLLEALCIVIHKHDFDHNNTKFMQPLLRRALSRAIDLLVENTSYDLCQICLTVMKAFMESSVSSFMGGIISHSLAATSQLIEAHSQHGQDALIAQAKSFLSDTLRTFSAQGVFLNLLRKPLNEPFFHIMRQILNEDVKAQGPEDPLREALLRDTILRIADLDPKNLLTVMGNLQKYVTTVFHQNYSKDLIALVASQLAFASRRLPSGLNQDISSCKPFFEVPIILIQYNKANCWEMLVNLETIVRQMLSKLPVDQSTLSRLLNVTSKLHRRTGSEDDIVQTSVLAPLKESLLEGLRCRAPVAPVTISSLIQVLTQGGSPASPPSLALEASFVDPYFTFLQHHRWVQQSESDLKASLVVAKALSMAAKNDPGVIGRLNDQDKSKSSLSLRTWNIILLSTLDETGGDDSWMSTLFAQFNAFHLNYHIALRNIVDNTVPPESAVIEINHAYIALKLWLIFAYQRGQKQDKGDVPSLAIWNQLWPPFELLVNQFEKESRAGSSSATILFTLSSCADLLTFVHHLQCPVSIHAAWHLELLERLKGLKGSATGKLTRAINVLSGPPQPVPLSILLSQLGKDIVAAEKLRMLEHGVTRGGLRGMSDIRS